MVEPAAGIVYIVRTLRASTALIAAIGGNPANVTADQGKKVFPFVSVAPYTGTDFPVVGSGGGRLTTSMQYLVRVVVKGGENFEAAAAIAHEIDEALDNATGSTVTIATKDYYIPGATRETPHFMQETVDGVRYWYMGGIYRVPVDPM